MVIDLVNPFVQRIQYKTEGDIRQELYLYSPDGNRIAEMQKEFEQRGFGVGIRQQIREDETELSYLFVDYADHLIRAFRSITSHYEFFYCILAKDSFIITDHMRNMMCRLSGKDREVSIEGVLDTVLFQHNYGRDTYLKGVYRLGYGEELKVQDGKVSVSVSEKLALGKYELKHENGADVLEHSMREACRLMRQEDCVNTLSGGVDSTLTHIVMGNPKSVSGSYEYDAFLKEKEYALNAAALLGADHTVYDIELPDYMTLLKKVSEAYGMPPYNLTAQGMHYVLAEKVDASQMMLSELAGAVYGLEMRTPYTEDGARKYPFDSPYHYSNINSMVAAKQDMNYIEKLFGKELVEKQLAKRSEYVLSRLTGFDFEDYSKDNCLQFGNLICWFSNSGMGILEQMENPFGKRVNALFSAKKLVESFLSLELANRYEDSEYGEKPYAKQLLERLLPKYEVNKPKLGGSLPRTWMVTEGPMAGYFQEHEIPHFVPEQLHQDMRQPSWETSWGVKYMIMYSIWKENVFDKDVSGIPSKYYEEI